MNIVLISVGGLVVFSVITNTVKGILRNSGDFKTIEEIDFIQKCVYGTCALYSSITVIKLIVSSI